jgi:MFS family permease
MTRYNNSKNREELASHPSPISPFDPIQETAIVSGPVRILVICLASAGWAFHFGVGTQVISHWLKNEQHLSDTVIGLNHSTYYLGLALSSLAVPWLMRRWGRICPPVGMILSGLTLALFPLDYSLAWWFALRFLNGAAAGLSLIPLESLISRDSEKDQRTRNFGFYAVALTLSGALGIWAGLDSYAHWGALTFYVGSCAPILAGFALAAWLAWPAAEVEHSSDPVPIVIHHKFLSFGTAWSQGFLEGGMLAFLSLYLMSRHGGLGLSADAAGGLMAVLMVGVILFQVPVSWLADRLGKVPVLLGCYAVVVLGLIVIPWFGPSLWLAVMFFLFGACSGALYPLGLSLLGEGMSDHSLPRLYAWYMAIECFGSQLGAAAMGKGRDWWGESAMFAVGLAAIFCVLVAWTILRALHNRGQQTNLLPSSANSSPREAA